MSHRTALALSIMLTLVLAAGIIAGRDRLFAAEAAPSASGIPSVQTTESTATASEREANATGPQVIEIPLPTGATDGTSSRINSDDAQSRGDRDTSHERDHDDENEHEEDDDD
jgi:hypothetical protein